MRILGLDLSLRSTGYVLLDEDDVAWYGVVGSDTLRESERLAMFDRWIREQLRDKRFTHVAVEGYSYGTPQGHTHAFGIGELGGVMKLAIHQAGIPMQVIAPGTWKKVLCGNGSLSKKNSAVELYKRYAIEFHSQDTLDAWAVAMCRRRQLLGLDKPEPKTRKRRPAPDGKSDPLPLLETVSAGHE
jgi:Holliday junction resolvasome RuvABC endonuclease subunit